MTNILEDTSTPSLVAAIETNLWAFILKSGTYTQAEIHDDPDMLWVMTGLPVGLHNGVLRGDVMPDNLDTTIKKVIERGRSRQAPILWSTGPATRPSDLGTHLERHGFIRDHDMVGMALDLAILKAPPAPPDLIIEQVKDIETAQKWIEASGAGFELPESLTQVVVERLARAGVGPEAGTRNYIGWLNGNAVATSMLFLGEGIAGVYCVATAPAARRQGIGAAMTHFALQEAKVLGYRVGILQASAMGYSVYRQLGFQEYCKIGQFHWSPEAVPV